MIRWGRWHIGLFLILLATAVRLCWTLAVPTIPVGDFATYRESAMYLAEFGHLDSGFVYMPGLVVLLAALHRAGGDLLAAKMLGAAFGGLAAGPVYVIAARLLKKGPWEGPLNPPRDGACGPSPPAPTRLLKKGPWEGPLNPPRDGACGLSPPAPTRLLKKGPWEGPLNPPLDDGQSPQPEQGDASPATTDLAAPLAPAQRPVSPWRQAAPVLAGLSYALWPAGIALSSVIGTDIPTAALLMTALALLCAWGETRPIAAALAFGATMGVAAYFRAVALPLTALSAVYWLAIRTGWRATVMRTAVAVAMTVLLLLPWGWRNYQRNGEFYLTDSHGGITALMGNYPNSEGVHSRSLAVMFRQLTGRTFLMEPHRVTDRVAYALAKQWIAFDWRWTAGMIALRTQRLLAPERGLLYWPIYRPGVIPRDSAAWFNQHRREITAVADLFYLLFVVGLIGGVAFSVAERRWTILVPLPFAIMLAATYALFVAEPRYRVTSEVLLFPLFGYGGARLARAVGRLVVRPVLRSVLRSGLPPVVPPVPHAQPSSPTQSRSSLLLSFAARLPAPTHADWRGLLFATAGLSSVALLALAVVHGGAALRRHHRWAATVWRVDGEPRLAMWRAAPAGTDASPVRGAAPGAALILKANEGAAVAEAILPQPITTGGRVRIEAALSWTDAAPPIAATLAMAGITAAAGADHLSGVIDVTGAPLRVWARLAVPAGGTHDSVEVVISDVTVTAVGAP